MGNFRGRKLLYRSFVAIHKSIFFMKFGDVVSFGMAKASNLQNFLCENCIFHQFAKVFLPRKFPAIRYKFCERLEV